MRSTRRASAARYAFETLSPLGFPLDQPCFTGGALAIGLPAGTVQLTFDEDGAVHVDGDGDGTADADYASCLTLSRDACE